MDKKFLKSKPICKVTFVAPSELVGDAQKVVLLGDFNSWNSEESVELKKLANGNFKGTVDLETGKRYEFRYLADGQTWLNDPQADALADNQFGGQNSVVDLTEA